jgi:hypothetical protein
LSWTEDVEAMAAAQEVLALAAIAEKKALLAAKRQLVEEMEKDLEEQRRRTADQIARWVPTAGEGAGWFVEIKTNAPEPLDLADTLLVQRLSSILSVLYFLAAERKERQLASFRNAFAPWELAHAIVRHRLDRGARAMFKHDIILPHLPDRPNFEKYQPLRAFSANEYMYPKTSRRAVVYARDECDLYTGSTDDFARRYVSAVGDLVPLGYKEGTWNMWRLVGMCAPLFMWRSRLKNVHPDFFELDATIVLDGRAQKATLDDTELFEPLRLLIESAMLLCVVTQHCMTIISFSTGSCRELRTCARRRPCSKQNFWFAAMESSLCTQSSPATSCYR